MQKLVIKFDLYKESTSMTEIRNIPLVSSEIAGLWNTYTSDTLAIRVLSYFLKNVQDNEIRTLMQHSMDISSSHIPVITDIFNQEGLPLPNGYTEQDVNLNAPRLFTDAFYAAYINFMARAGMHNYTLILNQIARADIRDFFSKRISECVDIYNKATELRLSKGIFIRAPHVVVPKEVQYVKKHSFMTDFFGEKRPLLANEITQVFSIIFINIMGRAIATAFGQVSKDKKVSDCLFDGKDLSSKIIDELTSVFNDEEIPIPSNSDSFVTDSTEAPFSEKLMLSHILLMSTIGISSKGMAMSESARGDLQAKYMKYLVEIMNYTKKCSDILIDNGWLEQPPQAIKHENLVNV
jgi:hypothetical protein